MISISNIAWDVQLDDQVAELMSRQGVKFIDIAPPKYFPDIANTTEHEVETVKTYWQKHKIQPLGMQSLLFGTQGLSVFADTATQQAMLDHLSHVCRIGDRLDARKLVFGSPKNRQRGDLSHAQAQVIAKEFFNRLGDIARQHNVVICLEPNPACYQCDFMTTSLETADVVAAIDHPNVKMQLDVGAMCINQEVPSEVVPQVSQLVHHVHISEPNLAPLNIHNDYHQLVAPEIKKALPNKALAIEMLTSGQTNAMQEIADAVSLLQTHYMD